MRAIVAKVLTNTNSYGSSISLNRYGAVTDAGITCTNGTLNYTDGVFISSIIVSYDSKESVISKVSITNSKNNTLSRGQTVSGAKSKTFNFTKAE